MALVDAMATRDAELSVSFASYATGADTLRRCNRPVHDLGLPEEHGYLETMYKAYDLIKQLRPNVVVAHEEFSALAAARLNATPSIFISAWLPAPGSVASESLDDACAVIVLDHPGIFQAPATLRSPPKYVGPVYRKMQFTRADRPMLRRELGISIDALVIAAVPGGAVSEAHSPIAETLFKAFSQLRQPESRLFWIGGKDTEAVAQVAGSFSGVEVRPFLQPIEKILAAADLVVTRGTRGITLDAAALGIPSLSLSPATNRIDDLLVPRIRSNVALYASAVDENVLLYHIQHLYGTTALPPPHAAGAEMAADTLYHEIVKLADSAGPP